MRDRSKKKSPRNAFGEFAGTRHQESGMKLMLVRFGTAAAAALTIALTGCGGGGGGGTAAEPAPTASLQQSLAAAAAQAANDTSTNSTASFSVLQSAGMPAVSINSAPKVNFAVFSDGKVVSSVTLGSVSFAIAKLVPGTNGNPDQWVNYVYRTETGAAGVGPNGTPALASAKQATADPKQSDAALAAAQLVYNADGYYTYTFRADITDPNWTATVGTTPYSTNGVVYEPNQVHRVAIQLSYKNAAGVLMRVNPYFDFTIDAAGKAVPATARKMVDIATCNGCHDKLALHGGGRVDTQYCVMCHNPGTTDANSGNVLTLSTMVHKIHSGKELHAQGESYTIWGNSNSKHDYSEVGFPQPTRNCAACHTASNPLTPQGDNWKTRPSKEACLSCHLSGAGSTFNTIHVTSLKLATTTAAISNSACASCHGPASPYAPERIHWVQEMANAALYQGKIESVTLKTAPTATTAGKITVKYSVVNPATGAAYDLREGCTQAATTDFAGTSIVGCNANYRWDAVLPPAVPGKPQDKFGTFTIYAGYNTLAQAVDDVTGTANYAAYRGVDDGSHHYTVDLTLPAGSNGNVRVMMIGSVAERRIDPATRLAKGAFPPVANADLAYVPVHNAIYEFDLATGAKSTTAARRQIVATANCNSCHGILGLPTHADANKPGFHKGVRNNAEGCAICHNANQAGGYTLMTDGTTGPVAGDSQLAAGNTSSFLHESYQAKRFVHGIHYGSKRTTPFTHCMNVGGSYNKDGSNTVAGGPSLGEATCVNQYPGETDNFTAEVAYPATPGNCANCHVSDSWKNDRSVLGSVVFKPTGVTNALDWLVISPKAATCTSCHDSKTAQAHVTTVGGATFGTLTQNAVVGGQVFEACSGCHASGSPKGVDVVHKK
jgi:OmcA/MtrC family decaheme c-type cytochrome